MAAYVYFAFKGNLGKIRTHSRVIDWSPAFA